MEDSNSEYPYDAFLEPILAEQRERLAAVEPDGNLYSNVEAPGDLWTLEKQVSPHWWIISNHLQ